VEWPPIDTTSLWRDYRTQILGIELPDEIRSYSRFICERHPQTHHDRWAEKVDQRLKDSRKILWLVGLPFGFMYIIPCRKGKNNFARSHVHCHDKAWIRVGAWASVYYNNPTTGSYRKPSRHKEWRSAGYGIRHCRLRCHLLVTGNERFDLR
jgi:hypothetical protein